MTSKPKFSVSKAIKKSMILWDIDKDIQKQLKVYYRSDLETRKKPVLSPCIVVDYNKNKREWYIFLHSDKEILGCTIDDITGSGSIKSLD
jgi:hypothetical protein